MADAPPAARRLEFAFADGLRALAALTITLLHAYLFTGRSHQVRYGLPRVFRVFELGDLAVPIFIVLSGFVLMLPVARTDAFDFRTGHWAFFRRRARRLLPPLLRGHRAVPGADRGRAVAQTPARHAVGLQDPDQF